MPSKSDPILVFRDEIMAQVIKNKLIDLAVDNKGTFETLGDFYNQFRERYEVTVSDAAIRNWLKELDIRLQSSFHFIDQRTLDDMDQKKRLALREVSNDGEVTDDDLDNLFDNE